ncbi:cytochrome P450 [Leucogyrophana mollusca]|uniref:Cytochrome P450 n=1 Tax=Leucogyrophana mollusca TaxID=85980 RepID=A0ACB8BTM2_9AGAM|nr:cytochrome P450 [Leucogyrophana mollusca]
MESLSRVSTIAYPALCAGSALALFLLISTWLRPTIEDRVPLPPGPQPLPLVGNLFALDRARPWLTYTEWGKRYGELVTVRLFGKVYIIVNSAKVAKALIDRHSAVYSDRPVIATSKLFGMDFNTAHLRYGDRWRAHRKMFHQVFRAEAVTTYHSLQTQKAHQLVRDLLDSPENFIRHLGSMSTSVIMAIVYGYEMSPQNDPFVEGISKLVGMTSSALTPEKAIILGAIPLLQRLPAWFPGAGFKRSATQCRKLAPEVITAPFDLVKERMASWTASQSMVSDLLEQIDQKDRVAQEQVIKDCATSAFLAGADSTQATLLTFVMAMVLHPEAQTRAQAEIDAVVGKDRLPDFSDRPSLPYVDAVLRETQRWGALVPLAVPHVAISDVVYEGYLIPKGAAVITNLWAMAKDNNVYSDPAQFNPERHITRDGRLSETFTDVSWGFGRRVCPGRYLADASVWIAIASILATLNIGKATGKAGYEIEITPEFSAGLAMYVHTNSIFLSPLFRD